MKKILLIMTIFAIYVNIYAADNGTNMQDVRVNKETPFMALVKLKSLESKLDFQRAKKYIDVACVYSKYEEDISGKKSEIDPKSAESEWKENLTKIYNLGHTKKFQNFHITNFYDYEIEEIINDTLGKAVVIMQDNNENIERKKITYNFERRNGQWVVVEHKSEILPGKALE